MPWRDTEMVATLEAGVDATLAELPAGSGVVR